MGGAGAVTGSNLTGARVKNPYVLVVQKVSIEEGDWESGGRGD